MEEIIYCMENLYGDTVEIHATDGGPARAVYFDCDLNERAVKEFPGGEDDAYAWAYRRGYRE